MKDNYPNEESRAREFLGRVGRIQRQLKWKKAQVEQLRELSTSCSVQISDMPRSDSPNLQRLEMLVCKISDMDAEIRQDEVALADAKIETALMICRILNAAQQQVLTERYINMRSWSNIAEETGFSISYVYRLHENALCAVESQLAMDALEHSECS